MFFIGYFLHKIWKLFYKLCQCSVCVIHMYEICRHISSWLSLRNLLGVYTLFGIIWYYFIFSIVTKVCGCFDVLSMTKSQDHKQGVHYSTLWCDLRVWLANPVRTTGWLDKMNSPSFIEPIREGVRKIVSYTSLWCNLVKALSWLA